MTLEEAKKDMERFVTLKTSMRPAFVDVLLQAEEVRHGHWIVQDNWRICKCSNCESAEFVDWALDQAHYCPNCGAKMDEEVER